MIRKFTITSKIIMLSVALVAVTSSIVGAIFFYGSNQNVAQQSSEQLIQKIEILKIFLEEKIEESRALATVISNNEEIKKYAMMPGENKDALVSKISSLLDQKNSIEEITIYLENKNAMIQMKRTLSGEISVSSKSYNNENILAFKGNDGFKFKVDTEHSHISAIQLTPIRIGNNTVGVLYTAMNLQSIILAMKKFAVKHHEFSILHDTGKYIMKGEYISSQGSETPSFGRDYPEVIPLINGQNKFITILKSMNHQHHSVHAVKIIMPHTEQVIGIVAGVANFEPILRDFDSIRKKSIITSVLMIFLSMILSIIMSKMLTKSLMAITKAAKDYMEGKEDIKLPTESSDEISVLANTFQGMIHRVNERTRRIKRSEEKSIKAKEQAESAHMIAEEARMQAEDANYQKSILLMDVRRQKEKIEAISKDKDDLMAIVSHDLKNPLAVIESSVGLIRDTEKNLNAESIELLMRAHSSARFAINLITDLLDLARLEGGIKLEIEKFNLLNLVNAAIFAHELPARDKRIEIKFNIQDDYFLDGDYTRILQVLNNLIGNSIKFTPAGGSILIEAEPNEGKNEQLHLKLSDTGRGIPEDKIESIFNKYEQAQSSDRKIGTGLGLAICNQIIQMHQGKIWVESKIGNGSTFHILLPGLHIEKDNTILEMNSKSKDIGATSMVKAPAQRVLLIDDSEDIEALVRMMIQDEHIEFDWAADGRSGVLAYMKGKHDVILMDLNMPVMNGLKTTQIIRALETKMQITHSTILAITASSDEESKRQCIEAGCNGTLNKPIKKETLLTALGHRSQFKKAS